MKFRQVHDLIKKYVDDGLDDVKTIFLKVHISEGINCDDELSDQKYIIRILNSKDTYKNAPDGFTDRVMKEISSINIKNNENDGCYTALYSINQILRRVGVSLVATAFVMFFTMLLPFGKLSWLHYEPDKNYGAGVITHKFDSVDFQLKKIFLNINESIDKLKGD